MNIPPQASSSSQVLLADTRMAEAREEAIFNDIAHYLGDSQISPGEKIGLCSRLITAAKNHLRFMTPRKKIDDTKNPLRFMTPREKIDDTKIIHLNRLTLQEREQKVSPEWQEMLANRHIKVKHLRIRDFLPALRDDWVVTAEDVSLLKGMAMNSGSDEVMYLLDMLAKKDSNAYREMSAFIESRESLQRLLPDF